jgi:hypothetical protein
MYGPDPILYMAADGTNNLTTPATHTPAVRPERQLADLSSKQLTAIDIRPLLSLIFARLVSGSWDARATRHESPHRRLFGRPI